MLRNTKRYVLMDENDGTSNGGGGGGNQPQTFSLEYVQELRRENKTLRTRANEAEGKLTAAEQAVKDAEGRVTAAQADANKVADQRVARAELKALAVKAGIVDLDGLKLVDLDKITINDKGEIEGGDALIEGLKKDKPYLFTASQSSSTQTPPPSEQPAKKNAAEMTDAEYAAEKARLVAGK
jgi:hypothetical protein